MANSFFNDVFNAVSGEEFEEIPVDIVEFVEGKKYLSAYEDYRLSDYQYELVRAMSQIYRYETLVALYGEKRAIERWKETFREIIMQLGKGSGKDFTSTIAVAYVVYLCLCLKSPTKYFKNATIDIINVAINADQAQRVFFKNFVSIIKACPWFEGKYDDKTNYVDFDKKVSVYSGHSEREAYEGYNTLIVILDEISGFATESASGNQNAKTASAIYDMYKGSITSRNAELGKLVLLSFPRYEDDFIQTKYKEVIAEKETIMRSATIKRDPDLPDGFEGNEFDIEWEEDHIIRYKYKYIFALRRPSWEVNPSKDLQIDYGQDFDRNPGDALGRFACMPSNLEDGFFKNIAKIEAAFEGTNGVDQEGIFHPNFVAEPETRYFMHVDLAQKHDYCAVAMGHVDHWVNVSIGALNVEEILPFVKIDALRYWTPTKEKSVDFKDVVAYIKAVRRRGFDLKLVTFDRWNSHDTMLDLKRNGIDTDTLSVAKKHYDDFLATMYDDRLAGPADEVLIKELSQLRLIKGKIDHPSSGTKDLSDAVCGAIYNAVMLTPYDEEKEVDVYTLQDLQKLAKDPIPAPVEDDKVIRAPRSGAPDDIMRILMHMDRGYDNKDEPELEPRLL